MSFALRSAHHTLSALNKSSSLSVANSGSTFLSLDSNVAMIFHQLPATAGLRQGGRKSLPRIWRTQFNGFRLKLKPPQAPWHTLFALIQWNPPWTVSRPRFCGFSSSSRLYTLPQDMHMCWVKYKARSDRNIREAPRIRLEPRIFILGDVKLADLAAENSSYTLQVGHRKIV